MELHLINHCLVFPVRCTVGLRVCVCECVLVDEYTKKHSSLASKSLINPGISHL